MAPSKKMVVSCVKLKLKFCDWIVYMMHNVFRFHTFKIIAPSLTKMLSAKSSPKWTKVVVGMHHAQCT